MPQVSITELPQAQTLQGTESVPIVQNGVTVQTTTGAIAGAAALNYPFVTFGTTAGLTQARQITAGAGISLADGGVGSTLAVNLTGAAVSLNSSGTGIQVKTAPNTVTGRSLAVGTGLTIANSDGVSGDPTVGLGTLLQQLVSLSGSGILALRSSLPTKVTLQGTASQISIANGDASAGDPTFSLTSTGVTPGSYTSANITVDATGRITAAANGAGGGGGVTLINTSGGITGGPITTTGTISLGNTSVTPGSYTSANITVDSTGRVTAASNGTGGGSVTSVSGTANEITATGTTAVTLSLPSALTFTGKTITGGAFNATSASVGGDTVATVNAAQVLTSKTISGATNSLSAIGNASLTNSSITINGSAVSLGGSTTVTAVSPNVLTIGTGLTGTSYNGSAAVTVAIDSTVATLTGTQTLTNKTYANPLVTGATKLTATGASAYTPFIQTFSSAVSNFNGYQLNYIQNTNNGSDASVDYVAYNDSSDVDSYFIDMGISSSNFTNAIYTVFPPNGAYVYTGGGTSGQAAALLLGTSNAASDITLFTGGTLLANTRATIKGNTGNVLINTTTDTGYKLNVNGTTYFGGASTFGSTVLLNANPTLALQAATKQYVDSAVLTGFVVHPSVSYATAAALPTNTYNNGASGVGATLTAAVNGALSVDGNAVTTSQRILVKNEVAQANNGAYTVTQTGSAILPYILTRATDFDTAGAGEIANNAYFFVSAGATEAGSSFVLSQTAAITVGTTALPFTLFNDQLNYVGGTNIDITGLTISLTGTVAATNGGTGTATVATGNLLYGSGTNTWSKLPLGIGYKSLVINAGGTQVEWNAVALNQAAAVSGQLGISNGGTGASTASAAFNALSPITSTGDLILGNGVNSATRLGIGANAYVLTSNGTTASWQPATGGVTQIVAGTNITISPAGGTGVVTVNASTSSTAAYSRTSYTATAAQTSFAVTYTVGLLEVYVNGVLLNGADYTATSGTAFVLAVACNAGDIVEALAFNSFSVASTVTSFNGGTTGLTPASPTTGNVTLAGTLAVANGGTGTATPSIVAGTNVTVSGTWPNQTVNSSGTSSPVFKGALLAQTSATTSISPINTYINITFDTTVYDTAGGAFTGTSNRLTIPAGVSYVRLLGSVLGTSATDQFIARIVKNGSPTIYSTVNDTDTTGGDGVSALTPVLAVVEGDYFQLQAFSAVARSTTAGVSTWFSIEVVQGSILNVTI